MIVLLIPNSVAYITTILPVMTATLVFILKSPNKNRNTEKIFKLHVINYNDKIKNLPCPRRKFDIYIFCVMSYCEGSYTLPITPHRSDVFVCSAQPFSICMTTFLTTNSFYFIFICNNIFLNCNVDSFALKPILLDGKMKRKT